MTYTYITEGTCAKEITFEVEGDVIKSVKFTGGCKGNLKAIPCLVEGLTADEISEKLSGITCGERPTSCADQLARAVAAGVKAYKEQNN